MSPVFIIVCLAVFLGVVGLCAYYKNCYEEQKLSNDILKRRNETLEERFEQEAV